LAFERNGGVPVTSRILLLAPLFLSPTAAAQVLVSGVVQPVPGPTICMQGETHLLECTGVFLRSSTVNLNSFVGQAVLATGSDIGLTCHVIEVSQVVYASLVLSRAGTPTLGQTVTFTLCLYSSLSGDVYGIFFSASSGFFPIDLSLGTVLLGPPVFILGGGPNLICADLPVAIPFDPSLVGASFWAQGVVGAPFLTQLSNAVCLTIS
jgi:hypothetical protein